jgi:putative zinc finger/helix-turn-helix YgiT family protein
MSEKPFPRKCPKCRKPALAPVVEDYATTLDHDGRSYAVTVPALAVLTCSACGNRTLDDEANKAVTRALYRAAGLLEPEAVRALLARHKVTQKQFAEQLGLAEATVSRWVTGAQIQQRAFDTILRAYDAVPEFREHLARKGSSVAPGQPAGLSSASAHAKVG